MSRFLDSAFPSVTTDLYDDDGADLPHGRVRSFGGMTLRDYFAGQALAAVVMHMQQRSDGFDEDETDARDAAEKSYTFADAMLKAREAGK